MLTSGTAEFVGWVQVCPKLKFIPPVTLLPISHGEEVEADLRHADRCVGSVYAQSTGAPD